MTKNTKSTSAKPVRLHSSQTSVQTPNEHQKSQLPCVLFISNHLKLFSNQASLYILLHPTLYFLNQTLQQPILIDHSDNIANVPPSGFELIFSNSICLWLENCDCGFRRAFRLLKESNITFHPLHRSRKYTIM